MNYGEKEMDHGHARLRSLYTDFQSSANKDMTIEEVYRKLTYADAKKWSTLITFLLCAIQTIQNGPKMALFGKMAKKGGPGPPLVKPD